MAGDDFLAAVYRHLYQFHNASGCRFIDSIEFRERFVQMFHGQDQPLVRQWLERPENQSIQAMYHRSRRSAYTIIHTCADADKGHFPPPSGEGTYSDRGVARKELETARINLRGYLLCCIYGDYPRSEQPGIYRECAGLFQGMALRRVLLYAQSCYLPLLILDHWGAERFLPYCFSLMRRGRVWSAGIQTVIRQWLGRVRG